MVMTNYSGPCIFQWQVAVCFYDVLYIYNAKYPFVNFINLSVNVSVMAHPYKWTISKLRHNNNLLLSTTHKR